MSTALTGPVVAGPAACTGSGTAYACEGNQSGGVTVGAAPNPPATIRTLTIDNLTPLSSGDPYSRPFVWNSPTTGDTELTFDLDMGEVVQSITSGTANVVFRAQASANNARGANLKLNILSGQFGNSAASLVDVISRGGSGSEGSAGKGGTKPSNGGTGGTGGAGGTLAFVVGEENGSTSFNSPLSGEPLSFLSAGGTGGKGGPGGGSGGVQTSGGSGGTAGAGGAIYIQSAGDTVLTGAFLEASSRGGTGGEGNSARNPDAPSGKGRGGNGGVAGVGGHIYLDVDADGQTSGGSWDITTGAQFGIKLLTEGGAGGEGGSRQRGGGGNGGNGANAGSITLGDVSRTVSATGSVAVSLSSIGGNGGDANSGSTDNAPTASGGASGRGNTIDINGTWNIAGFKNATAGIVATSVGGDGGRSQDSGMGKYTSGIAGGAGGKIFLNTNGPSVIATTRSAVRLLSQGGGGSPGKTSGDGGPASAIVLGQSANGDYGTGSWALSTTGSNEAAISVRSLGGGGGNAPDDGFTGGAGGNSGDITLADGVSYAISTSGDDAPGVNLVTLGGLGGNGSEPSTGNFTGDSGAGGSGGNIFLTGSADINTTGDGSSGFVATTTGGVAGQSNFGKARAGAGGDITVFGDADYDIRTQGDSALGLSLTSAGGNNGDGGPGSAGGYIEFNGGFDVTTFGDTASGIVLSTTAGVGGLGGSITLNTDTTVTTHGSGSIGVFASSVGGENAAGGGITLSGQSSQTIVTNGKTAHGLRILSRGSGSGIGGAIGLSGSLDITTNGEGAHALFASSVGAAGHTIMLDAGADFDVKTRGDAAYGVNLLSQGGVGGGKGVGGNLWTGGSVSAVTTGSDAHGYYAASIGSESRAGGNITSASSARYAISTTGDGAYGAAFVSTAGNDQDSGSAAVGGKISLNGDFEVTTAGDGAHGVFVASTGTAGGAGGSVTSASSARFAISTTGEGAYGAAFLSTAGDDQDSGSAAVGGNININGDFEVTTEGDEAHGVFATSTGMSGGAGGNVFMTVSGPEVTTFGEKAHGVFAQSVAIDDGSGSVGVGTIAVTASTDVSAEGDGSYGIFAQAAPLNNGTPGNITVSVDKGFSVFGAEAGVALESTGQKYVGNFGTIGSVFGPDGVAVAFSQPFGANLDNLGTLIGSVVKSLDGTNTGTGNVEIDNQRSGRIFAGSKLEADLTNSGVLYGYAAGTTVTGDFLQRESGETLIAFGDDGASPLMVAGNAEVAGTLGLNLSGSEYLTLLETRSQTVTVLEAGGELKLDSELTAAGPAIAQMQLSRTSAGAVNLSYDVNFANDAITAVTNSNQDALLDRLQDAYERGDLLALVPEEAQILAAIEDIGEFASAANSLSAEVYANTQLAALSSAQAFSQRLMSCSDTAGTYRFISQDQCVWFFAGGSRRKQDDNTVSTGFDQYTYSVAGGAQFKLRPGTHLGFALAYQYVSLDMDSARSDGDMVRFGVAAKHQKGPALFSAAISAGNGTFDSTRTPATGGGAQGRQDITTFSGLIRGAYEVNRGNWTLIPQLDLGIDYVDAGGFEESGLSNLTLAGQSTSDTYVYLRPAMEFGHETQGESGMLFRTTLSVGLSQYLTYAPPGVVSKYDFSGGNKSFISSARLDRTSLDLGARFEIFDDDRFRLSGELLTNFSKNSRAIGAGLTAQIRF